jgi:hypothetical protein
MKPFCKIIQIKLYYIIQLLFCCDHYFMKIHMSNHMMLHSCTAHNPQEQWNTMCTSRNSDSVSYCPFTLWCIRALNYAFLLLLLWHNSPMLGLGLPYQAPSVLSVLSCEREGGGVGVCVCMCMYVCVCMCVLPFCRGFRGLISDFETFVSLSPNPQPGGPGYLF